MFRSESLRGQMSGRYSKFNEAEDTAVTVMSHEHSSVNDILTVCPSDSSILQ